MYNFDQSKISGTHTSKMLQYTYCTGFKALLSYKEIETSITWKLLSFLSMCAC